jgi:hypothetical protein
MQKPMWQLLLEDPSSLTEEECLAVVEFYFEMFGYHSEALTAPVLSKYLAQCPEGAIAERLARYRQVEGRTRSLFPLEEEAENAEPAGISRRSPRGK